jgi:hypothetical protein
MSYPVLFGTTASQGGSLLSYTGTGLDGDAIISSNTFLTVPSKNGAYDGDMVVKNYSSLTINSGARLSPDQPCRGMLIYVQGNCTINGRLSMSGYGASANPTVGGASDGNAVSSSGLLLPFRTQAGLTSVSGSASYANGFGNAARAALANHTSGTGTVITVARDGAAGNTSPGNSTPGNPGSNGSTGQSGGGGSGGSYSGGISAASGSNGYIFAGGAGGGGSDNNVGGSATNATQYGGGGRGGGYGGLVAEGGAGNPHGTSSGNYSTYGYTVYDDPNSSIGNTGPGGLLILVVGGTLTIDSGSTIEANGNNPSLTQTNASVVAGGGGCSGGGNVVVAYKSIVNNGSIIANGGVASGFTYPGGRYGGSGGNGSVQTLAII